MAEDVGGSKLPENPKGWSGAEVFRLVGFIYFFPLDSELQLVAVFVNC